MHDIERSDFNDGFELSEDLRGVVEDAERELDAGLGIPHEIVMSELRAWLTAR